MSETITAPAAARKKPKRSLYYNALVGALFIDVENDAYAYWVDRLPHGGEPHLRLYRLSKFAACREEGDLPDYDVTVDTATGKGDCGCKGFLRWGAKGGSPGSNPCKHIAAILRLLELGQLR